MTLPLDEMIQDACEVERFVIPVLLPPAGRRLSKLCAHVKALACEVERLTEEAARLRAGLEAIADSDDPPARHMAARTLAGEDVRREGFYEGL